MLQQSAQEENKASKGDEEIYGRLLKMLDPSAHRAPLLIARGTEAQEIHVRGERKERVCHPAPSCAL